MKLEQLYVLGEEDECPELLTDTPYEIKMSPLEELPGSKIDIYDESDGKTKKYHEIESERSFKTWDISSFGIFRVYTVSDTEREKLEPYAKKMIENERSESVITNERSESVITNERSESADTSY